MTKAGAVGLAAHSIGTAVGVRRATAARGACRARAAAVDVRFVGIANAVRAVHGSACSAARRLRVRDTGILARASRARETRSAVVTRLAGRPRASTAHGLAAAICALSARAASGLHGTIGLAGVAANDDTLEAFDDHAAGAKLVDRERRDQGVETAICQQLLAWGRFAFAVQHEGVVPVTTRHIVRAAARRDQHATGSEQAAKCGLNVDVGRPGDTEQEVHSCRVRFDHCSTER